MSYSPPSSSSIDLRTTTILVHTLVTSDFRIESVWGLSQRIEKANGKRKGTETSASLRLKGAHTKVSRRPPLQCPPDVVQTGRRGRVTGPTSLNHLPLTDLSNLWSIGSHPRRDLFGGHEDAVAGPKSRDDKLTLRVERLFTSRHNPNEGLSRVPTKTQNKTKKSYTLLGRDYPLFSPPLGVRTLRH